MLAWSRLTESSSRLTWADEIFPILIVSWVSFSVFTKVSPW